MGRPSRNRVPIDDGLTLIRRGSTGLWTARVFVRGRETWRSSGLRVLEAARPWALKLRTRLELEAAGEVVPLSDHEPIPGLVDLWIAELERLERSKDYTTQVRAKVLEVLRGIDRLDEVTPDRVRQELARVAVARTVAPDTPESLAKVMRSPLSTASQDQYLVAVRRFFRWLVETKRWATNPAVGVKGPRVVSSDPRRALTIDEARRLLAVAPLERRACYAVAMCTGLRRSELDALKWGNLVQDARGWRFDLLGRSTKNEGDAELRLGPKVVACLRELRAARAARPRDARQRVGWQDGERIFSAPEVPTLHRDLAKAGIDWQDHGRGKLVLHSLRMGQGTALKDLGASPNVTQAAMRHASIEQTLGTYVDLHAGELASAIDQLDAALGPALRSDLEANLPAPVAAPRGGANSGRSSGPGARSSARADKTSRQNPPQIARNGRAGAGSTRKRKAGG